MKHIGIYAGALAVTSIPFVAFAQATDSSGALSTLLAIEDNSNILEMISLWSVLSVSLATSVMVWMGGRGMRGGVFGSVLNLFSVGMSLVFLGLVTEVPWLQTIDHLYLKMVHDSLFIIGYIMMGLAASKLLKAIKGE